MTKLKAVYGSCLLVLLLALSGAAQDKNQRPIPPLEPPPDHVNVALFESDYQDLAQAFRGAIKSRGIQDGATEGLWVVRLKPTLARKLMFTIFNAQQGIPPESTRKHP